MNRFFFYTNQIEQVSTRSQNIINTLGGISELLKHYNKFNSFLNLQNVGKNSNEELVAFSIFLKEQELKIEIDAVDKIKDLPNSILDIINAELSNQAQDTIKFLGGISKLIEFYKKHKNFLGLAKVGRLCNDELCLFCKYLLGIIKTKQLVIENKYSVLVANTINDIELNAEDIILIYETEKLFLSVRVKNVLNLLEKDNSYYKATSYKIEYINKYFLKKFDFSVIHNLGAKSKLELQSFRNKILYFNKTNVTHFSDTKSPLNKKLVEISGLDLTISIDENDLTTFYIDDEYSFTNSLCVYLNFNRKIKSKSIAVMKSLFFDENILNKKMLADELQTTPERIRQIIVSLNTKLIPEAIKFVGNNFEGKPSELKFNSESNFLELENFSHFTFQKTLFTPNRSLSKLGFSILLEESYELIDNLIFELFQSFQTPKCNLFVSKKFIEATSLIKLLTWLNTQIFNFETIAFDYRLDVLINRYFHEENCPISPNDLKDLNKIISSIKRESFEIVVSKRQEKKDLITSIITEVYSFLKETAVSNKTTQILEHLSDKGIVIERGALIRYLKIQKSTFSYFGNGNWTLNELKNSEDTLTGTLRDIVRQLLTNRNDPIHISELYNHFNVIRNVSLHSIKSNLKADSNATFKFFNCSYIGLSDKKYDDYWNSIPQFQSFHLTKNQQNGNIKQEQAFIKQLSSKYGYPIQHLQFIIDCKKGKYNLEAINKQTELKFSNGK